MKKFSLIILSFFAILLFSCQKEVDYIDYSPPETESDSIYIKMLVTVDTALPPGMDTLYKTVFHYDNQQRFTRMVTYAGDDPGFSSSMSFTEERVHYYTGNAKLPYKVSYAYVDETGAFDEADTSFLSYENGIVVRDSTLVYRGAAMILQEKIVYTYSKKEANSWRGASFYFLPGMPPAESAAAISYSDSLAGNITQEIDTTFVNDEPFEALKRVTEYDDRPNPFRNSTGFGLVYPVRMLSVLDMSSILALSKNNRTSTITTFWRKDEDEIVEQEIITYKYRADGYPVSFLTSLNINSSTEKTYIIYTDL